MPLNCPFRTPKIFLICLRQAEATAALEKTGLTGPRPSVIMEGGGRISDPRKLIIWVIADKPCFLRL